jgi:hypothetical protein
MGNTCCSEPRKKEDTGDMKDLKEKIEDPPTISQYEIDKSIAEK